MRWTWVIAWAGCAGPAPDKDTGPTPTTTPSTSFVPTGTGPATGIWSGTCAGSFDVAGTATTGGSAALTFATTTTYTFQLEPAILRLSDDAGSVAGQFEYTRADLPDLESDAYRVQGERAGTALPLRIVGLATTSSTLPTTAPQVFPFGLDLTVGATLAGDLVVSDGDTELGRVGCSFSP